MNVCPKLLEVRSSKSTKTMPSLEKQDDVFIIIGILMVNSYV